MLELKSEIKQVILWKKNNLDLGLGKKERGIKGEAFTSKWVIVLCSAESWRIILMIAVYCSFHCWVNIVELFLQTQNLASSLLFMPFRKKKKKRERCYNTDSSFLHWMHWMYSFTYDIYWLCNMHNFSTAVHSPFNWVCSLRLLLHGLGKANVLLESD